MEEYIKEENVARDNIIEENIDEYNCGKNNIIEETKDDDKIIKDNKRKKINAKYIIIMAIVLMVVIAGFASVLTIKSRNEQKEKQRQEEALAKQQEELEKYYNNFENVVYTMLYGGADAETVGNLIINVWSNSIYEERDDSTDVYTMKDGKFLEDFNDALANLFASDEYLEPIEDIEENQKQVIELMKKLVNPPDDYKETYRILEKYYESYLKITNYARDPQGSLKSFSKKFREADDEFVKYYDKIKLYLE